jgi:hypothetical protein
MQTESSGKLDQDPASSEISFVEYKSMVYSPPRGADLLVNELSPWHGVRKFTSVFRKDRHRTVS